MEERTGLRRKRLVESIGDDEQCEGTSTIADAETMAQRRIVRVRRPASSDVASSLSGAFKGVSGVLPAGAPALSTKFSFGDDKEGSGGGVAPAATSALFSFSGKPAADNSAGDQKFSSFASPEKKSNDANGNNGGDGASRGEGGCAGSSLFGEAFKFNGVVSSFAEAKERMVKTRVEAPEKAAPQETLASSDALAKADPVASSTGDVLASMSCKLFVFKSEIKQWAECGAGVAKIKRHEFPAPGGGEETQTKYAYRLIVRDGYALNALLCSNFCLTKVEGTHIIFALPQNEKIVTYLLRFAGEQVAERGAEFIKTLKETLSLAQEISS